MAAIRMAADGISLKDAAKYLDVEEAYLRHSILNIRINKRLIVERKKGYIFVGDDTGGIHYPSSDTNLKFLWLQIAKELVVLGQELATEDLNQIFTRWFRKFDPSELEDYIK